MIEIQKDSDEQCAVKQICISDFAVYEKYPFTCNQGVGSRLERIKT